MALVKKRTFISTIDSIFNTKKIKLWVKLKNY